MNFYRGETVTLSRKDFYKKVWSKSAVQLAKEFGISDVAIAKLCKKHRIPKPPLGYWARVQHGQQVNRPPLPKLSDDKLEEVRFQRWHDASEREMQDPEIAARIEAEKVTAHMIVVGTELIDPHLLVESTHKSLSSAAADGRGIVRPRVKQCLNVAVSKANIDRAMRIMDALVKALDARGYAVAVIEKDEARDTVVTVMGEPLKIGLSENTDCKKRPPTAEQLARQVKYSWATPPIIYDYTPSGKLKLSILTGGYDNLRRNWTDLVQQPVEDRLNSFVAALVKVAESEKAARVESERRKREWEEQQRRREEEARRLADEKTRVNDLLSKAESWHHSQELRSYVAAVEEAALQKLGKIDLDTALGRWLDWAKRHADVIDPVQKALQTLIDFERQTVETDRPG